jgi:hypothetical protein
LIENEYVYTYTTDLNRQLLSNMTQTGSYIVASPSNTSSM